MSKIIKKQSNQSLVKKLKFVEWDKFLPKSLNFSKESNAGVILDKKKNPQFFIFNTPAFLDILSEIDENLSEKLTHSEYYSKSTNPAGYLIDKIESKMSEDQSFVQSLKDIVEESDKKGWLPFSRIQKELGLKQ